MKVVSLNGKWSLTGKPQISEEIPISLEATVPGCVQLDLYACNDTLETKQGNLTVKDALSDEIICQCEFSAKENASTLITSIPTYYSEQKILVFEWKVNGECGFNHYLCGYPPIPLKMYKQFLKKYNVE